MPTTSAGGFRHLADVVLRERGSRTQREIATAADFGVTTLRKLESGREWSYGPIVRRKVERIFRWQEGEFDRVLRGLDPKRRTNSRKERFDELWDQLEDRYQRVLIQLARNFFEEQTGETDPADALERRSM